VHQRRPVGQQEVERERGLDRAQLFERHGQEHVKRKVGEEEDTVTQGQCCFSIAYIRHDVVVVFVYFITNIAQKDKGRRSVRAKALVIEKGDGEVARNVKLDHAC